MNYEIYSTSGDVVIGEDTISGSGMVLLDLKCLENKALHNDLFEKVQSEQLVIQYNGEDVVEGLSIISFVIQLFIDEEKEALIEDFKERKRTNSLTNIDPTEVDIDRSYNDKTKAGDSYHRKTRAGWVKKVQLGEMTSSELFAIDKKIKDAKRSLIDGDWITAKYFIEESVVDEFYTEEIKQQFLSDINYQINILYGQL